MRYNLVPELNDISYKRGLLCSRNEIKYSFIAVFSEFLILDGSGDLEQKAGKIRATLGS